MELQEPVMQKFKGNHTILKWNTCWRWK